MQRFRFAVQVEIRLEKLIDEFLGHTEFRFQGRYAFGLVDVVEVKVAAADTQRVQVSWRFRGAVIGRKDNQRLVKPHRFVDKAKEIGQCAIEPMQVVLGFEARSSEEMTDIVS